MVPIVEGQSEVDSIPVLARRVLEEREASSVDVARPFRVTRNRIVRPGELERAINQAIQGRANVGCILLLLDADDDCPAELGPQLLARCKRVTDLPVGVVLAQKELEGWFLGAKESLGGVRGIRKNAVAPANPEAIRGAKERLSENMEGRRYLAVDDQPALAERMDFALARQRCLSFDKFLREVHRVLRELVRP